MIPLAKDAKKRAAASATHQDDHVKDSILYKQALEDVVAGINYESSRGNQTCSIEVNSVSVGNTLIEELKKAKYKVRVFDKTIRIYW